MKVPISWLKDYTKIKTPIEKLMWRMTEIGMTTESYGEVEGEKVLDVEVTPNRPDWLSIVGIAREIAVIEDTKLKHPKIKEPPEPKNKLKLSIDNNFDLCPRYSAIVIKDVKTKPSPKKIQKRLKMVGLRPINNLIDITNYVMFELGNPIHVFDYDKLKSGKLKLTLSKEGEDFTSVDGKTYELPKDAIIFKSGGKVVDLCGIKGGQNSGVSDSTKNILLLAAVYDGIHVRNTSQKLKLSSEASYIFERGVDLKATTKTINRAVQLTLKNTRGEIASEIETKPEEKIKRKEVALDHKKLESVLGVNIEKEKAVAILEKLQFEPEIKNEKITCKAPSFRKDVTIEEDLIEEIARIYGYNNFPATLPEGKTAKEKIPFHYDRDFEMYLKNLMMGAGFTETNTLALTSKDSLKKAQLDTDNAIKIANPVSLEYEYMRTSLIPSLIEAVNTNKEEGKLKLFEYNKIYLPPVDKAEEVYKVSAILTNSEYKDAKGVVDLILERLNIQDFDIKSSAVEKGMWHPTKSAVIEKKDNFIGTVGEIHPEVLQNFEIKNQVFAFELDVATLKNLCEKKLYSPIPKYPPQIEDVTLKIPTQTPVGDVINSIIDSHKHVSNAKLKDEYKQTFTFRISYQHPNKTLKDKDVDRIRKKLLKNVKKETGAIFKEK